MERSIEHGFLKPIVTFDEIAGRIFHYTCGGYCLWVGTGVTQHIAQFGDVSTLSWPGLVAAMEKKAGLAEGIGEFPDRLQAVSDRIPSINFQQDLRELFLIPLCRAIVELENIRHEKPDVFYRIINSVMKLGLKANSIVNFNIESFTSILLAFTFDYQIKSFKPLKDPRLKIVSNPIFKHPSDDGLRQYNHRHLRSVFHPHGSIGESGISVLKRSEYNILSRSSTLAFQLAVHHAFQTPLLIVGMSLQDEYLCEQLQKFRHDIEEIYWFVAAMPSEEKVQWAAQNRITLVKFDTWKELWDSIHETPLIPQTSDLLIREGWKNVYLLAKEIIEGKERIRIDIQNPDINAEMKALLRQLADEQGLIL
jgi:hypothetical protein